MALGDFGVSVSPNTVARLLRQTGYSLRDLSPRLVNVHDFRSDSTGVAIPYGIYDLFANRGSVMVGVSHDTSAFAAHAIAH